MVITAVVMSLALVPAARALGARWSVLDHPGERKIHETPVPRTGGWAVLLAFMLTVALGWALRSHLAAVPLLAEVAAGGFRMLSEAGRVADKLAAVLAGASLAFLVGLADDLFGARFPVGWKAAGQVAAASLVVAAGVKTSFLPYDWMNVALTIVWLVGITNAFNAPRQHGRTGGWHRGDRDRFRLAFLLMDGNMDGAALAAGLVGALVGFLLFNFNPASIFMGDTGSLFIGVVVSGLSLLGGWSRPGGALSVLPRDRKN